MHRQLNLEIHIADIAAAAIIANDIDHQSRLCLSWIERRFAIIHQGRHLDLVALPRLDGDGPGNIFQLEANVLAGGKAARNFLLRQRETRRSEDNENRGNR